MDRTTLVVFAVRLALGGCVSFFAIIVWSKTRNVTWSTLAMGMVVEYAGVIYDMLVELGITYAEHVMIFGVPLVGLLFSVLPPALYITALVQYLVHNHLKL